MFFRISKPMSGLLVIAACGCDASPAEDNLKLDQLCGDSCTTPAALIVESDGRIRLPYEAWPGPPAMAGGEIRASALTSGASCTAQTPTTSDPSVGVCLVPPGGKVRLEAVPYADYTFAAWTGCIDNGAGDYYREAAAEITVADAKLGSCKANFFKKVVHQSVAQSSGGKATIAISWDDSAGASFCDSDTSCFLQNGKSGIVATATPDATHSFDHWSALRTTTNEPVDLGSFADDLELRIYPTSDYVYTPTFVAKSSTPSQPGGSFTVTGADNGELGQVQATSGNGTCSGNTCTVVSGGSVTLTAVGINLFVGIHGWACTDGTSAGEGAFLLTLDGVTSNVTCRANFYNTLAP